ncbi:MAG: SprT family zinc-dependent metalloprotease [Alphaproteobacteria bacterium]|nr:SprT family zinc-dependent metalloprotease [Alphaproteobacteria bacterium]
MSIGRYREVRLGGRGLRVAVRRNPRARRISLRVQGGEVRLTLPPGASEAAGLAFLKSRGEWIEARLRDTPEPVPFRPGAAVPFRGRSRLICVVPGLRDPLRVEEDRILLATAAGCERLVEGWLRREARLAFEEAAARHAAALGVEPGGISIRDQKTRWGSASAAGRLNFNWRAVMAPPFVLDYLAAHEVAHLREMNHGPRFWSLCRRLCPETDAAERWLKAEGPGLHRYGRAPAGPEG